MFFIFLLILTQKIQFTYHDIMNKWIKIFLVIFTFAIISVLMYLIFKIFNLTSFNEIKQLILKSKQYGILVYFLLTTVMLVCLCFMPLLNTSLIVLGILLFGSKTTFFVCIIAAFISSTILFFIGDKLGEKFAKKLIGEKDLAEAQNLVDYKSKFWLPVLFIVPGVPDEALCLVAGMTKMKYWYLILISVLYHAVELGIICFIGSGIIDWSNLTLIDWFVLGNVLLIDFLILTNLEKKLNNKK